MCGLITSLHYFLLSPAQDDLQRGFQPPRRGEQLFVAAAMLRRPEPTKVRVEPMTCGTTAIEFPHSTRLTLLLLLRIQRYMWRITTPHNCLWIWQMFSVWNCTSKVIESNYLHTWAQLGGGQGGRVPHFFRQWGYNMPCTPHFSL